MSGERINLAHGDGGELAHRLIQDVFVKAFGHEREAQQDAAIFDSPGTKLALTTDSFVIQPLFFPGGSIGKLAVAGTVNDLAVSGAVPLFLTASFIIEEGFRLTDLKQIVADMATEASNANVKIVAGDTKVVERGSADGLFINTAGVGRVIETTSTPVQEGDSVIVSGSIGDHGMAVLAARGELGLEMDLDSDCACLHAPIEALLNEIDGVKVMRDPTRGGLATTLVEICESEDLEIQLEEEAIPVRREVHGACDLLGFDPLYLANEGKVVMIVAEEVEEDVLQLLKKYKETEESKVIGRVTATTNGRILLETALGSRRMLRRLAGMQFPRIC
ncbi:hydrogenase expression/formation protein HypE [Bacillus solimangrovi]|uniref:Hydrogenase expression/formation protein HypE n=1 Tax=Bacillus solimangrovi TaxID=1305675 RepID=A0A1E5LFF1_9BACI|nr:hydrogenase expression/formation protein HypE [Bacillus solimangrovi]OEH92807.1 hydrogenase expression/formation protein HypE [Bacillus solimangrovi]